MSDTGFDLPEPPVFTEAEMAECEKTGDYMPVIYEWYKYVGMMAFLLGHIMPESPAFRSVRPQHYYILMGLLNRCGRLILANVALSENGKFGETTAIVDRCIFEAALKIIWLCFKDDPEEFNRYMGGGLKTELELKAEVLANIAARDGVSLPIEDRMLRSIERHVQVSGLSEAEIQSVKPLRDVASMLLALGHDRLFYVVAQRLGSHHVHGTWSSLLFHYIEKRDDDSEFAFGPRGHDCNTYIDQFNFNALFVISAMQGYSKYFLDDDSHKAMFELLESASVKIQQLRNAIGDA